LIYHTKNGFKLLWKAIDKSNKKDEDYEPNYNLGWIAIPIAVTFFVATRLITDGTYEWYFIIFYSIFTFFFCLLIFAMFLSYNDAKIKKKSKENQNEVIKQLQEKINHLEEKLETQTKIINKLKEEEGYGFAVRELYIAFSILNQYFYDKKNKPQSSKKEAEDEIKNIIKSFCNCLSEIYTKKVGAKCSVSIKLIEGNFEKHRLESIVKNFERDKDSDDRDENKDYRSHDHKVSDNTCFFGIVNDYIKYNEDRLFYPNHSLPTDITYMTSSLDCIVDNLSRKDKKRIRKGLIDPIERQKIWNKYISYKSELVVPLLLAHKPLDNSLIGFLCIDSEIENAFNEEFDVPLIKGVADGIYEIITDFKSLT
jgi:hypothetical protein